MLDMRLRIPELMDRKGSKIKTAYALSKASGLSMTNAHHLVHTQGCVARADMNTLDALCRAFGVEPNELLEREKKRA